MNQKRFYSRFRLALLAAAVILVVTPAGAQAVMLALLTAILVVVWFFGALGARSRAAPIAEIGTWFVAGVAAYTIIPLLVYLALGQKYTIFNDNRLLVIQPSHLEVAATGWLYVIFLSSFAAAYMATRGHAEPPPSVRTNVTRQTLGVLVGFWLILTLLKGITIPTQTAGSVYEGGDVAVAVLPLGIRQIMRLWMSWGVLISLAVRVWLFQSYDKRKLILFAWVGYDLALGLMSRGSRTGSVISLATCFLMYHLFVRPIRLRTAVFAGGSGLLVFLALGAVRSAQNFGTAVSSFSGSGGEFESLFGNAVDLRSRLANGEVGNLSLQFHLADILAAFPSQIVPFQKVEPAVWYIGTFYPLFASQGHGFAFGAIAQGILGFGWIEIIIRGAILGYVFARFHRYFVRNTHRFWIVVLYIWITCMAYQSFRDQTFILLSIVIQQFVSLVLVVEGLKHLLRRRKPGVSAPVTVMNPQPEG